MKDYLWIIVASVFAIAAFLFFILTLSTSASLIKRLKKRKINIMLNIMVLIIGFANLGLAIHILQDVRGQIERFSNF